MYYGQRVQVLEGGGQVVHHAAGVTLGVLGGGRDCLEQVTALEPSSV